MDQIISNRPTRVLLNPTDRVQIVNASLSQLDQDFSLIVDVLNVSKVAVSNFVFSVNFYDEFSKPLFDGASFSFSAPDAIVEPHQLYYFKPFPLDERFHIARQIDIRIQSAVFDDKTESLYQSSDQSYYELPIISLEKHQEMKDYIAPDCITYGENLKASWRCICGSTNLRAEFECGNCHRNKFYVLNTLTKPLIDQKISAALNPVAEETPAPPKEKPQLSSENMLQKLRGQTLDTMKFRTKKDIFFLVLILILASLLLLLAHTQFKTTNLYKNYQLKKADELIEADELAEAKTLYQNLSDHAPEDLASRQENLDSLIESKAHFEMGLSVLDGKDPFVALNHFTKVLPEDGLRYNEAHEHIANLESKILSTSQEYLDQNQIDQALDLLHRLLNTLPNSAEGLNLLDQILEIDTISPAQRARLNEIKEKEKEKERLSQPLSSEDKKRAELSEKASDLLHSFQMVNEDHANLRKGPSLDAEILLSLPKNSDVYIYETVIEKTDRIWCHVEAQSPQGDLSQGWISSRVLENKAD